MSILLEQLCSDWQIMEQKTGGTLLISDACFKRPPLKSDDYKKLALATMGCDVSADVKSRKQAYIHFSRLLRDLRALYKRQHPPLPKQPHQALTCARFPSHKLARLHGNDDMYHKLLSLPLQEPILQPTAMPVEVAAEADLMPFFEHLKQNIPATAVFCDKNGDYISFPRGAHYTDGRIDLCKQVVGPDHIRTLMRAIIQNPFVQHFLLGNNIIGVVGGEAIGTFLSTRHRESRIKTWYLAGNALDATGIEYVTRGLAFDTDCESLWLKRNPLQPEGIKRVADMLRTNRTIRVLDLTNTACLDEGVHYLFDALQENTTLQLLYLDANGITTKGAARIGKYFETVGRPGLVGLFLGMNRICDGGTKAIIHGLKSYPYLTNLCLSSNRITRDGLNTLVRRLPISLLYLDLGMYKSTPDMGELPNYFSGCGDLLAQLIERPSNLVGLDISSSHLKEDDIKQIAVATTCNPKLLCLHVRQYGLRSAWIKKVGDLIHWNMDRKGVTKENVDREFRFSRHFASVRWIDSIYRNRM